MLFCQPPTSHWVENSDVMSHFSFFSTEKREGSKRVNVSHLFSTKLVRFLKLGCCLREFLFLKLSVSWRMCGCSLVCDCLSRYIGNRFEEWETLRKSWSAFSKISMEKDGIFSVLCKIFWSSNNEVSCSTFTLVECENKNWWMFSNLRPPTSTFNYFQWIRGFEYQLLPN